MADSVDSWRRLGEEARIAHEAVTKAFRAGLHQQDAALYSSLVSAFREATALALPSSRRDFISGLARRHQREQNTAISFLEADPWFFRSGYEKQKLIQHLKRAHLSLGQRARLWQVVLAAIDGRDRAEFRHYGRLACGVWSLHLEDEVHRRLDSADAGIRRRAGWVAYAAVHSGKA